MIKKRKTKVLIIDDNHSILQYLKTLLSRYNFEIRTSENGYDGLNEVAEFKPEIIFLDLMMPNIDGIQMLKLKNKLNEIKNIPVIVISANAGRNNVMAAIEAGADRVLAKPINIKLLKASVNEVLGGNYFELEKSDSELKLEDIEHSVDYELKEKLDEYKDLLIDAVKNRDSESIKRIAGLLKSYCSANGNKINFEIINEIESRRYYKPSDWMFAEMKLKELEQNLRETIKYY
ncbi:MAG: response regulator [Melioribacteraceae bacterium]|nr:response regulator [Melioribacteraceae bacterium]